MFGWGELGLILILALILLGPDSMVDVARKLGKLYGEYTKAKRKFELELMYGYNLDYDVLKKFEEMKEKSLIESAEQKIGVKDINKVVDKGVDK